MMRVAVYVRVSTARQVHPQTIEQPLERLRAWVAEIFARYLEPGASLFKVARILRESHICSPTGKPI